MSSKSIAGLDAQAEALDPPLDHRRPADEDRPREPLVDDDLHGAQHALVLAFGVDDALRRLSSRRVEDRLHQQAGVIDELRAAARDRRRNRRSAASPRRSPSRPSPPPARCVTMRRGSNGLGMRYSGPNAQVLDAVRRARRCPTARPCARSAIARTQASFIASLIVVAPTSSAPRKMNGKHRTLFTWFGKVRAPGRDDRVGRARPSRRPA